MKVPNWPKDPDERRRKAAIAAKKKKRRLRRASADRRRRSAAAGSADQYRASGGGSARCRHDASGYASDRNGTALTDPVYDKPGDLFTGGAAALSDWSGVSNMFGGGKTVPVEPGTEPTRKALTQPPAGYQTPSTGFAYGDEKKGWLDGTANPDRNPLAQRSSATSVVH